MLSNSYSFNTEFSVLPTNNLSLDRDHALNADLRLLAQRVKFKAQFLPQVNEFSSPEKLKKIELSKSKSLKVEEDKFFSYSQDTLRDIYHYKESIFKEIPLLVLSVEQFGTLEVIEDYLLNKLASKEDANGNKGYRKYNKFEDQMQDFIKEKLENNEFEENKDESQLESSSLEDEANLSASNSVATSLRNVIKSPVITKAGISKAKTAGSGIGGSLNNIGSGNNNTDLGILPLQKSESLKLKSETMNKITYKQDRKRWVDRFTGKDINFKKYLDVKFYVNGEEIDKTKTIYEIFCRFRNNNKPYNHYMDDQFIIGYGIFAKKQDYFSYGQLFTAKESIRPNNSISLDYKQILQNMIVKIKDTESLLVDEDVTSILQVMILINELKDLDKKLLSFATPFNQLLIELKNKPELTSIVDTFKQEKEDKLLIYEPIIEDNSLLNQKISHSLNKAFNVKSKNFPFINIIFLTYLGSYDSCCWSRT